MMGLSKVGSAITVIISLTLAALFLEILYVLLRRRPGGAHFLCWKRQSRVGPNRTSPPEVAEEHVMKWHGPSRVLFTIKEEDREGLDSVDTKSKSVCYSDSGREFVQLVIHTTPFSTPCASPPYYTPPSSPLRDVPNADAALKQDPLSESHQDFTKEDVQVMDQVLS